MHEQQQQHGCLLPAGRQRGWPATSRSVLLQPAGCCLHRALQSRKRLCRAAMVCAQPDGDQLLGCLLYRPPGGLRQAAGQAPAWKESGQENYGRISISQMQGFTCNVLWCRACKV